MNEALGEDDGVGAVPGAVPGDVSFSPDLGALVKNAFWEYERLGAVPGAVPGKVSYSPDRGASVNEAVSEVPEGPTGAVTFTVVVVVVL